MIRCKRCQVGVDGRLRSCAVGRLMVAVGFVLALLPLASMPAPAAQGGLTITVTADMREYAGEGAYDSSDYFRGAVEAIAAQGGGAFMVSPGDIDPPAGVLWTIEHVLGTDYPWYPVVGNHEAETPEDMDWLRSYDYDQNGIGVPPDIVNTGPSGCPETTYSYDYENVHLVVLNEYCDASGDTATDGDIPDHLYEWLIADLQATPREHILVFGHEPAYPQPDADNGRLRHVGDSLDKYPATRDRFWDLLVSEGVVAYVCGHTHNYSAIQIDSVWQLDAAHARGAGDTGAASTFFMIHVDGDTVTFDAYRDDHDGVYDYDDVIHSEELTPGGTPVALIPTGDTWKYLDDGSDQGTAWQALGFDDSTWSAGPAQLGYGDGDEATVVSYGPDPDNKYITTYFRRTFDVVDASSIGALALHLLRDDGVVVYLNGTEIFRSNMPPGPIDYMTAADSAIGGYAEDTFHVWGVDPDLLTTGDNVLAVEIHQVSGTSSDISLNLKLVGTVLAPPCEPVEVLEVVPLTAGCEVTFTAELAGDAPYTYTWDFGALELSTVPTPTIDFGASGRYPFTLTVSNCSAAYSDTMTSTVAVECTAPTWYIYLPLVVRGG